MTEAEGGQGQEGPQERPEAAQEPRAWQSGVTQPGEIYEFGSADLVARLNGMIQGAVAEHRMGEQVEYALGLQILPQENGQLQPVFGVTMGIPSHIIGEKIHGTAMVADLWIKAAEVDRMVQEMLEALRGSRSQAMNGQGTGWSG